MTIVLDASVAVAATRPREAHHDQARALVYAILRHEVRIILPTLFLVEVVAALGRAGEPAAATRAYVNRLAKMAARIVPLEVGSASEAARMAQRFRLRAADAVYVWLAGRESVALCTLDGEVRDRARAACRIIAP